MRFNRKRIAQLHIPRQTNRLRAGMFRQPAIIMPAALPKPRAFGGKSDQWYKQQIRHQRLSGVARLHQAIGAGGKIVQTKRISVAAKLHRRILRAEMGQGDGVARFVKKPGIAAGRRFVGSGVIQPDHCGGADALGKRGGRTMKQQGEHIFRQGFDMRLAGGAQTLAEFGFAQIFHHPER